MLHIVYFSNITGNTERFMEKLAWPDTTKIPVRGELETPITRPYVIIVPSYGTERTGHVPPQVKKFLNKPENVKLLVGVIGAGNINFGEEYTAAATVISRRFQIPVLYRFEISGTEVDVQRIAEGLTLNETKLLSLWKEKQEQPPVLNPTTTNLKI